MDVVGIVCIAIVALAIAITLVSFPKETVTIEKILQIVNTKDFDVTAKTEVLAKKGSYVEFEIATPKLTCKVTRFMADKKVSMLIKFTMPAHRGKITFVADQEAVTEYIVGNSLTPQPIKDLGVRTILQTERVHAKIVNTIRSLSASPPGFAFEATH